MRYMRAEPDEPRRLSGRLADIGIRIRPNSFTVVDSVHSFLPTIKFDLLADENVRAHTCTRVDTATNIENKSYNTQYAVHTSYT